MATPVKVHGRAKLTPMQRRSLLRLGLVAGAVIGLAGAGAALWTPGWSQGRLSAPARQLWTAVSRAVLDGLLPTEPQAQARALQGQLDRLDATLAGLPPATRAEVSRLLALLDLAPARLALTGLRASWAEATPTEVQAALQSMRQSDNATRQQIYHALRNLVNAAWMADAAAWSALGYPGPRDLV